MTPDEIAETLQRRLDSLAKGMKAPEILDALGLTPVARGEPKQWSFEPADGWRERISIDGKQIDHTIRSPGANEDPEAKDRIAAASKAWRATLTERCGKSKKVDSTLVRFKLPDGGSVTTGKFETAGEDGRAYVIKSIIRL